jgi:hypothetical protein
MLGYKKILVSTALAFLMGTVVHSQIQQPQRFENENKFSDTDFTAISLKEEGIALIREKNKYHEGNQLWEIILLDTTLLETGTIEFEIDQNKNLLGFEQSPGMVYFLYYKSDINGYMTLVSVSLKTKEVIQYEIKPELNLQLTQFCKVGENFVFGGYVNKESAVLLYHPATDNLKVIPGFFQKDLELIDMRVNQNETFNSILIDRGDHSNKKLIFRTFDSSGKQILEDITTIDDDIVLLTSISSTLEREDLIMIGTWGKLTSKQASGFYTLSINPFAVQKINRVYFGTLQHYLDYLKPKKASKIKLKSSQAIEAGKIPDFTDYVMPFKIIEHAKGFLVLAESYNPVSSSPSQYQSVTPYSGMYPSYSPYGGYYPSSRIYNPQSTPQYGSNMQNTDEIKTIESVVLAIDGTGKVIWDYSLPLSSIKMPSLEQICDFTLIGDNIHFLYKNESELKIKTINLADQEVTETTEKIKLTNPTDEVKVEREQFGSIKHWYGNNFYVWGYQSIKNNASSEDKTRQVFYINKVVAH